MSHISCTALKKGTPQRTISSMNHRTWGTRCIKLVLPHTFCACYIDHRWPHSIVFFVIRLPVVLAKQACRSSTPMAMVLCIHALLDPETEILLMCIHTDSQSCSPAHSTHLCAHLCTHLYTSLIGFHDRSRYSQI